MLLTVSTLFIGGTAAAAPAGAWGEAWVIETENAGEAYYPQVAVDPAGNALAVWQQSSGPRWSIWANRYDAGSGWGAEALLETDNAGDAGPPQVAVDGAGNAVAVWHQSDGIRANIYANRYVVGMGWGNAVLIETNNAASAVNPDVVFDGAGNAVAAWHQSDGTRYNIWANRFVVGTGWGSAALIETDNAADAFGAQLAADAAGNVVAVWYQGDGTRDNIWANRYVPGSGWGTAVLIETDNAGDAGSPRVAVDAAGSAVAVWFQSDGSRNSIWSNRYVPGSGWGTAALIETNDVEEAYLAQVAVDAAGNAIAVWPQFDGSRENIWANRYVAGSGWGTAALIETNNAGGANNAQVALDRAGNAVAVWAQSDGAGFSIWAARYLVGSGWRTPVLVEPSNVGGAAQPQVAMDRAGTATAVWYQGDGAHTSVWANRLVEDYAPAIALSAPAALYESNLSSVWVAGTTEPGAALTVNGVDVAVAQDGSFGLMVNLAPGANLINATATDGAGNRASAFGIATYNDPAQLLQAELAAAQAALSAAQSDLAAVGADLASAEARVAGLESNASATQSELDAASAEVAAAQAALRAVEADGNATQAQLDGAEANLTAAQTRVASLEASAASSQADLAAARAQANATRGDLAAAQAQVNATRADLAASNARIAALEAKGNAAQAPAGEGAGALIGVVLGAAGIAVGAVALLRSGRGPRQRNVAVPPADLPPKP